MARVVLVGLPGTGKSTVALVLARHWNCAVVDTDEEVAHRAGVGVAELLRSHGESALRKLELDVVSDLARRDVVVATGGGVVATLGARELLKDHPTVWLDCDDEILITRLGDGDRPLLGDDWTASIARLRAQRTPWYEEVANARVDASGTAEQVAARVAAVVEGIDG